MNENLKNQSELLYTQAKQQFDTIKQAYESGDLTTEVAVIQAAFEAFQNFFSTLGHQRFEAIVFDESTPMWAEDYNSMMQDIYDDFEVLFREATLLADAMYVDFNHHVVQHDILSEKLKGIQNKMYDLAAYHSIEGYTTNVYAKEEFLNQDRIDYDKITMSPLTIEGGNVTLPQLSKVSALDEASISILLGSREDTLSPVGSLSNGYPGNNHEIVTATQNYDQTGKSLSLNFLGASNNHSNYGAALDGNPNTWFEFEKVIPTRLVNSVSEKDYGFSYKTAYDHYHYWTEPLEDGVLKLCLEVKLNSVKTINAIDVAMYTPANRLAQTAKIVKILVIDENNNSHNVAYHHTGTFFKFNAMKARAIQLFFEQENSYTTEIGHIFYTKKYLSEDSNGYKQSVVNRIAEANNRIDGPIPWITEIGAVIEEDTTRSEVFYAPRGPSEKNSSVDHILANLRSQIGMEDVEMGVERIQAERYCIGIKDIHVYEAEFEEEGELITKPFYFENPLERIALNISEADGFNASWLQYDISIDDGITWYPIVPMHRQEAGTKTYIIQQVERASGIIQKEGIIESDKPIYSMRIRIIGRRNEVQQQSRPVAIAVQSPILHTLEIQGVTRSKDEVLTYVSEEEEQFFQKDEAPIPPIEILPDQNENPAPCQICDETGNTGQDPIDPEFEEAYDPDSDPASKITSILKSDKYSICLDAEESSKRQVKVTYGAKSTSGFPLTEFRVTFDKFPHLNEHRFFSVNEEVYKFSRDVTIDMSLLEDGDELIVQSQGKNIDGFEFHDEIMIEVKEDCSTDSENTPSDKSKIEIEPIVVIGRVCEHTFHEAGSLYFSAYAKSKHPIVAYEIYEADAVVESKIFSEADSVKELNILHYVNKDLYSLEQKTKSPYIIVYDSKGKKKKKSLRLTLKDCLGKGKRDYLYVEFPSKNRDFCVDEQFSYRWRAGSSNRLRQVRIWIDGREVHNKVYALTSKTTRASGSIKIPYNQLEIGESTLVMEMKDAEGQVLTESRTVRFFGDCTEDDERRQDKINVTVHVNKSSYCPCEDDIIVSGKIKATPALDRVLFKINDMVFEPSRLNPLGQFNESVCQNGYPGVNPVIAASVDLSNMSSIERVEYMAENNLLKTNITEKDLAFMQSIEEYEINESCGCRKRKGTKQGLQSMSDVRALNATPAVFIEDISPVILKVSENLYEYKFSIPYWFLYESGFTAIGQTYTFSIEGINTEGTSDTDTARVRINTCNQETNPGDPTDPENPGGSTDPENPGNPDDPDNPDEETDDECRGDVIQAIHMTYYDFATHQFKEKRFSMLRGQATLNSRTLTDSWKNKIRVGVHEEEQTIWVQKVSKGEYPGFMIAQIVAEVGPKDLSTSKKYYMTEGVSVGKTESLDNLILSRGEINFNTHYLYNDLRNLGDTSAAPKLIQLHSHFTLSSSDIPWNDMCIQSHLNHVPKGLEEDMREEDIEELNCEDHKVVHIQYYDDVSRKLRDIYFNLIEGVGETRIIQSKNGSETTLEILAGYSGNSKGPAISISKSSEEDDRYLFISAIGIGYSQSSGGIDFRYAESIFYSTRSNPAYSEMLGEPKTLEALSWISNGVVDVDHAPWVGGYRDMISTRITLPGTACNPNDETIDKLLPIPSEEINNLEELENNNFITFESFAVPVFNNSIAPGEVEVVKGRFRVRRVWKPYRRLKIYVKYTFENTSTVIEEQRLTDYKGFPIVQTLERTTVHLYAMFEFRNMDHYGYGKVTKAEIFVALGEGSPITYTEYPNYSIQLPVEKGNRNETMEFEMIASTASSALNGICEDQTIDATYTFDVNYRLFDSTQKIVQFGVQIRSEESIIGEAYRTYSDVTVVSNQFPVLVEPLKKRLSGEDYYYAVPMVQFKGTSTLIPIAHYQLELKKLRCN